MSFPPSTGPIYCLRPRYEWAVVSMQCTDLYARAIGSDVTSEDSAVTFNIYDRAANDLGFLGMVQIKPVLINDHTVDQWYKCVHPLSLRPPQCSLILLSCSLPLASPFPASCRLPIATPSSISPLICLTTSPRPLEIILAHPRTHCAKFGFQHFVCSRSVSFSGRDHRSHTILPPKPKMGTVPLSLATIFLWRTATSCVRSLAAACSGLTRYCAIFVRRRSHLPTCGFVSPSPTPPPARSAALRFCGVTGR